MTHVKAGERRRAKAPKVRTGCRTCKRITNRHLRHRIRRVKCDEHQPACKRCTSTGRTCDGYDPQPVTKLPQFVTTLPVHYQSQEVRAFQFFYERTLPQLSTFFQDDFWNVTALQISNSQQGIWHSLVAFSAYHELYLSGTRKPIEQQDSFALRHYNLSIKEVLGPHQTTSDAHVHVVSCIMFICIEVLRGNLAAVVGLIKVGYSVLVESRNSASSSQGPVVPGDVDALYEQAHAFFMRLASQLYLLIGKLNPTISLITDEMIDTFTLERLSKGRFHSLSEAQTALISIRMEFERWEPGCILTVSAKLDAWSIAFREFEMRRAAHLTSRASQRTIALLNLHQRYFEVDLDVHSTGSAEDLLHWDMYLEAFEDMIDLAEKAMDVSDLPQQLASGPQFHMHTGAVPVLYAIIAKCRDPAIRRRAAAVLTSHSRLEGAWNAATVAGVALQAMAVEERGLPPQNCTEIPAEARVRRIKVSRANSQFVVSYETSQGWCWNQTAASGNI